MMLRLVVASTFGVFPPRSGGQRRMADVYGALADRGVDVRIVALAPYRTRTKRWTPRPGIREERIETSKAQQRLYGATSSSLGVVVDDALADETPRLTPAYVARLRDASKDADIVIATRPYLLSSIEAAWSGPIVYEAMDDEARLMAAILPENERGAALARHVEALEERALRRARLTFAISDDLAVAIGARYPGLAPDVLVVPPFCDPLAFSAPSIAARTARRIARFGAKPVVLFVGSSHMPNVEAARELATAAGRAPDLHFIFAGNVASELERKKLPPNVTLPGIVSEPELAALLALADVAVNPVRVTGGVNMKMLDYISAAVPVIATPVGVTGLAPEVVAALFVTDDGDWVTAARAALSHSSEEREERVTRAQRALATHQGASLVDELQRRLQAIAEH